MGVSDSFEYTCPSASATSQAGNSFATRGSVVRVRSSRPRIPPFGRAAHDQDRFMLSEESLRGHPVPLAAEPSANNLGLQGLIARRRPPAKR
jgi:hypothetical protein